MSLERRIEILEKRIEIMNEAFIKLCKSQEILCNKVEKDQEIIHKLLNEMRVILQRNLKEKPDLKLV